MSNDLSNKCEKCANEGEIALLPCPFCNQPVTIRWNTMTGEHYISHVDLNNRCPQRPFYGNEAQWNERPAENSLRAENDALFEKGRDRDEMARSLRHMSNELTWTQEKARGWQNRAEYAESKLNKLAKRADTAALDAAGE